MSTSSLFCLGIFLDEHLSSCNWKLALQLHFSKQDEHQDVFKDFFPTSNRFLIPIFADPKGSTWHIFFPSFFCLLQQRFKDPNSIWFQPDLISLYPHTWQERSAALFRRKIVNHPEMFYRSLLILHSRVNTRLLESSLFNILQLGKLYVHQMFPNMT